MPTGFVRACRCIGGVGEWRRDGRTGRWVLPALVGTGITAVVAAAIPVSHALADTGPPPPPAPAVSDASGLSVVVHSFGAADKRMVLAFDAVNATGTPMFLADRGDPMVLDDGHGGLWRSTDGPVRLDPLSTTSLQVDLGGPSVPKAGQLTLKLNQQGGGADHPSVAVGGIGVRGGHTIVFAQPPDRGVGLPATVGYNVDGVSVVVRRVDVKAGMIEMSILAVNGNVDAIKLLGDPQDQPYVQDSSGRKANFVPSADDVDLSIPGRQRLSGVLRFAGGLAPGANRLSLHFNDQFGSTDNDHGKTPKLVIDNINISPTGAGS